MIPPGKVSSSAPSNITSVWTFALRRATVSKETPKNYIDNLSEESKETGSPGWCLGARS